MTNSKLIDADRLAKDLDFPKSDYLKEIEKIFGNKIINEKGSLNREVLGNIIYNDFNKKVELDKITFKYVVAETEKKIIELSRENPDYILIDAPLLFEAEIDKKCDIIIAVISSENNKIERICRRDNINPQVAKSRLSIQKDDAFFKNNSDFVIENNGNIEDIKQEIERIIKNI